MRAVILALLLIAAQTFPAMMDMARQHVLAGEWEEAAELLAALRVANATDHGWHNDGA